MKQVYTKLISANNDIFQNEVKLVKNVLYLKKKNLNFS